MIYKNHILTPIKNSKRIFKCEKCDNIIQWQMGNWWYFLDYTRGGFFPLRDCHEMIIAEVLG